VSATVAPLVRRDVTLEYAARIKVHDPCEAGVLVELSGEFDVSCAEAFARALDRAASLGGVTFADLSGVTFMDAQCARELAARSGVGRLRCCAPSPQARLSFAACGLYGAVEVCAAGDAGYEAVIREACKHGATRTDGQRREHRLYLRTRSG
jgi:anti-anti-sigma regulatory factor